MKRVNIFILLMCIGISLCACRSEEYEVPQTTERYNHYEMDIYVSESEKEEWRAAIVKLISNQQTPYGEHGEIMGYEAPRPDEPSIASGLDMGCLTLRAMASRSCFLIWVVVRQGMITFTYMIFLLAKSLVK